MSEPGPSAFDQINTKSYSPGKIAKQFSLFILDYAKQGSVRGQLAVAGPQQVVAGLQKG